MEQIHCTSEPAGFKSLKSPLPLTTWMWV